MRDAIPVLFAIDTAAYTARDAVRHLWDSVRVKGQTAMLSNKDDWPTIERSNRTGYHSCIIGPDKHLGRVSAHDGDRRQNVLARRTIHLSNESCHCHASLFSGNNFIRTLS